MQLAEFLKFIGPRGQKIMRSANNVGNAGLHVRQTFLNDVFTFLTEVGNACRIVYVCPAELRRNASGMTTFL
jgi:hypothetical protein